MGRQTEVTKAAAISFLTLDFLVLNAVERMTQRYPSSVELESEAGADDRAVERLVDTDRIGAGTRTVVDAERAEAERGADLVAGGPPQVGVSADDLPGELTSRQSKAADVASEPKLLMGCKLMADTEANHRIHPLDCTLVCDRQIESAVEVFEAKAREVDVCRQVEGGVDRVIPITKAAQRIDGGERTLGTRPPIDLVHASHFDNEHLIGEGRVG